MRKHILQIGRIGRNHNGSRRTMVQEGQYEGYYDYMLRRTREVSSLSQMDLMKRDMADLTKSYYEVLKRNTELTNEITKLKNKIFVTILFFFCLN